MGTQKNRMNETVFNIIPQTPRHPFSLRADMVYWSEHNKSRAQENNTMVTITFISQPKHMIWVLKRTI